MSDIEKEKKYNKEIEHYLSLQRYAIFVVAVALIGEIVVRKYIEIGLLSLGIIMIFISTIGVSITLWKLIKITGFTQKITIDVLYAIINIVIIVLLIMLCQDI
jgi:hypothetical protein